MKGPGLGCIRHTCRRANQRHRGRRCCQTSGDGWCISVHDVDFRSAKSEGFSYISKITTYDFFGESPDSTSPLSDSYPEKRSLFPPSVVMTVRRMSAFRICCCVHFCLKAQPFVLTMGEAVCGLLLGRLIAVGAAIVSKRFDDTRRGRTALTNQITAELKASKMSTNVLVN